MTDARVFDEGTRPRILINWQAFVAQGIPSGWQGPFADAVMNAYTRWSSVAGIDERPQFFGYTMNTSPSQGELLVTMDAAFGGGPTPRLASTFSSIGGNTATTILHRRNAVDMTPWPWVPRNAQAGEIDMQGVFMHELGHALGLIDHSASADDTMFSSYSYSATRYGPFEGDVSRLKALYRDFDRNTYRNARSRDSGGSWSPVSTSVGAGGMPTNQNLASTALRGAGFYVLGWTAHPGWSRDRMPIVVLTDGSTVRHGAYGIVYQERSAHGCALASDDQGAALWAWVQNDPNATIRIAHSIVYSSPLLTALPPGDDIGWVLTTSPVAARACGTPGLAWTKVQGQSTWILVWANFDRSDQANTGYIYSSVSTDEGATWSNPAFLNQNLKALSGVSIAATEVNDVVVSFTFSNHISEVDMNEIISLNCSVAAGRLQQSAVVRTGEHTRFQPALAYDAPRDRFVMAWREQNFATTLATASMAPRSTTWAGKVMLLGSSSNIAPGLGSSVDFNETMLWYAYDGP
jgi:hypothetical protein